MAEEQGTTASGVIQDVATLDLTYAQSAAELSHITLIKDVATIIIPESLNGALARIPMADVASIVPVPEGERVKQHVGMVTVGGDALADPSQEGVILVVIGALVITSPVTVVRYSQIIVTGVVLAPQGSESALGAGLSRVTGAVEYYKYGEGQNIKTFSGQTKLSGEVLANPGGTPDDLLLVTGQLLITTPIRELGFQQIYLSGQLMAPRDSQTVLGPALRVQGQVCWYAGENPRFFLGDERFGQAFFELLDEPVSLVLLGNTEIEADVRPETLKEKVADIALAGDIKAPKSVIPVLQLLATEKYGDISVLEDDI